MLSPYNVRSLQLYFIVNKYPLRQRRSKTANIDEYLTFISIFYSLMHENICTLSSTNKICNCEQYANRSITHTRSNLKKTLFLE